MSENFNAIMLIDDVIAVRKQGKNSIKSKEVKITDANLIDLVTAIRELIESLILAKGNWKENNNSYLMTLVQEGMRFVKGFKFIIVVTGHGKMSEEIRGWVNGNPLTVAIEQDGNNTGSYRVKLKKNKPIQQKETKPSRLATSEDIAKLVAKWNN